MMLSANLLWLILLYGIQGIPYGFQVIFLPVLLHSSGTSLTKVSLMRALNLPWMLKLLWAPFITTSQTVKRPLTLSLMGLSIVFAIISFVPLQSLWILSACLLLINILVSFKDIAVDTFAIRSLSDSELGHGNAIQVVAYKFGAMLGGGVLTWASQYFTWMVLMVAVTCAYCIVTFVIQVALPVNLNCTSESNNVKISTSEHCSQSDDKVTSSPETSSESQRTARKVQLSCDRAIGHTYNLRSLNKRQRDSLGKLDHQSSQHSNDESEGIENGWHQLAKTFNKMDYSCDEDILDVAMETRFNRNILWTIYHDFAAVFRVKNTTWLLLYLLIYKLGEQGAVSIFPLYLLDQKVSTNQIAVWTGVISQWISIGGSVLGGWMVSLKSNQTRVFAVKLLWLCLFRSLSLALLSLLIHVVNAGPNFNIFILCLPFYIVQLIGGAITTATFTLMMTTSRGAHQASTQTLHHTTMASAEVIGKVFFTALSGFLIDQIGYVAGFYCFCLLSVLPVLPLSKTKS